MMIQAVAEKLVGVLGHFFPFRRQTTLQAFEQHFVPPLQQQTRIVFYDDDVDDEGNNYNNKDMWVYCPFNDCSVSLLNDGFQLVTNAECPSCHRLFCARCNVPWHSGLNCQQFQHKLKSSVDSRNNTPRKRKFLFDDDEENSDNDKKKKAANCSMNCPVEISRLELNVEEEEEDLQASIIECQKTTHCPFKNCSVLLVNDGDEGVTSAECPSCHRLFCAQCKVPWHGGINCQEFQQQKLKCSMHNVPNYDEKKGKEVATAIEGENNSRQSLQKSFCGICYDFIPENDIVRGSATCNHPFCANCISNHVAEQLIKNIMEFNCPNPRCFDELKPNHLHSILPEEVIARWESAKFRDANHDMKIHTKEKFRQFVYPLFEHVDTKYCDTPLSKSLCKTKNTPTKQFLCKRQKSSQPHHQHPALVQPEIPNWPNASELPLFMHKYIEDVTDVAGDGHCGFRAVAAIVGKTVYDYQLVRLDLTGELIKNREKYIKMFGGQTRFNELKHALNPAGIGPTVKDKWMIMPDMGFLIAQRYKYAVAMISRYGFSETYFPLDGKPAERERTMCLGYVNRNHFMIIHLKPDSPIPAVSPLWEKHRLESAEDWPTRYIHRMANYNDLQRAHEHIVVQDSSRPQHVNKVVVDVGTESVGAQAEETLDDSFVDEMVDLSKD